MIKLISIQGILCCVLVLSMNSCETKDDSLNVKSSVTPEKKEKSNLSCQELLNTPEKYEGKKVTLNAISWGTNSSIDGEEILMSIDDERLEGLQQAHVLVHFSKDQEDELKNVHENDSISVTATVGDYEYGALRLIQAKVSSKTE